MVEVGKKITVVVNGRFHAFDYAAELYKMGCLEKLISTMPYSVAKRYNIGKEVYVGLPFFEVLKRGYRKIFKKELPVLWYARLFTKTTLKFIPNSTEVVICFAGYAQEIFEAYKLKSVIKILDRGSTHTLSNIQLKKQAGDYHRYDYPANSQIFVERELLEYELANYILIPSKFVKQTFIENQVDKQKLIQIPYAFSSKKFKKITHSSTKRQNTVLFVGQLSPRKGTGVLIDAVKLVREHIPEVELWFVGSLQKGINKEHLKQDWIKYYGVLRGDSLVAKYQEATLFCLPSFEEGLALVLTEAKYFNLPIVATPNSGIEDLTIIDHKKYQLSEAGNVKELAFKIEKALKLDFEQSNNVNVFYHTWEDFTNQLLSRIK
ncbi:glycosyltransferase family 4 protein [Mariniflexile sp.]|uniref:glycosyltransferase family 4 protein n=1 Tax=Mariniflexile sp. TaxID=1979402 RepID=UPI00356ACC9D